MLRNLYNNYDLNEVFNGLNLEILKLKTNEEILL